MNDRDRLRLFALLSAMEEGVLAEAGRDELVALLKSSDEAQDLYLAYQGLSSSLSLYAREHVIASDDEPGALASLAEMEASAETTPQSMLDLPFSLEPKSEGQPDNDITLMRALDDLRWAAGKAATKLICSPFGITSAIAAILILGLYLFVPFGSTDEQTPPPDIADNTPSEPGPVGPALSTAVATLTAEHNAQWGSTPAERALARGSDLHAGQRLTLTAGFAEITTNAGAIAILEAPATIEFTHNNNALQLHSGKLVGICETETSKGFVVSTPHLDITDLGTRFGVDASTTDATEVHVFEGEVEARLPDAPADAQPMLLIANQSARTSADTDVITNIDHDADRFATLLPDTIQLPGTGVGLAVGDTDPNWQVVAVDGQPLNTPQLLRVTSNRFYNGQFANDPATSQWLSFTPAEQTGEEHAYQVRTAIDLPQDLSENGARLRLTYMADNAICSVTVNGHRVVLPEAQWTDGRNGYAPFQHATIGRHLVPGMNTFTFELVNIGSDTGLRVAWKLSDRLNQPEDAPATP